MEHAPTRITWVTLFITAFGVSASRGSDSPPQQAEAVTRSVLAAKQNDSLVVLLLATSTFGSTEKEAVAYVHDCEKAIAHAPNSPRKLDMYMRIGDVYYGLKQYRHMAPWYRRALSLNPSAEKATIIGLRLHEFAIDAIRSYILMAAYVLYGILACFLLARCISCWGWFHWLSFSKRGTLYLTLFCVLAGLVFLVDIRMSEKAAFTITTGELHNLWPGLLIKPFIPLSIIEAQPWHGAAIILALGFLPIAIAIFYTSYKKPYSRRLICILVCLAIISTWTNYFIVSAFDGQLKPTALIMKTRLWYRGDPETLLLRDPRKALHANPDLLKSDNEDLRAFLRKNYPDGLRLQEK
jgi:hypothetical protein